MDVMGAISAAHVEGRIGAIGPQHAEARQEFLHHVEVGSPKPSIRDIGRLDPSHARVPKR
jgi:hypothetical protein